MTLANAIDICRADELTKSRMKVMNKDKELYNSTRKRQHYFDILKAFFVRHSSEYKTSDSDRKVNRNIYPDAVTRDRMHLLGSLSDVLYSDECRTKKAFSMSK